jgi:hypothetical protein
MPPPKPPAAQPRYSYERVATEIQRQLAKRGTQARLAEALEIDSGTFRHRMNQRQGQRFTIEEIGVIATTLGAPKGWPWLSWEDASLFEAYEKLPQAARDILTQMVPKK